jgi:tryptophanyl-tRNA synthetase
VVTDAVNDRFAAIRRRRSDVAADPGLLRAVLQRGNDRASVIAEDTLRSVRTLMHTAYA